MDDTRLLKFLFDWRKRLAAKPIEHLSEEEMGQLITLNTVIWFVQNP